MLNFFPETPLRIALDHYESDNDQAAPAPQTIERHTHFSSGSQRLTVRQDYISVPTSPVKRPSVRNPPNTHGQFSDDQFRTELFDDNTDINDILAGDGKLLSGAEILEQQPGKSRKRNLVSVSHVHNHYSPFLTLEIGESTSCMGPLHRYVCGGGTTPRRVR